MIKLVKILMAIKGEKIRLKIFDIVVIFLFIFLAVSLFFVLFRKRSKISVVVKVNEESLAYQIGGVPNWFAQFLHVGMKEVGTFGESMAEIKEIKTYYSADQKSVVHLIVDLTTVYSLSNHKYVYGGKDVSIGSPIQLRLDNLLVKGLIIDIDGSTKTNLKRIYAEAQIKNLDPAFPQTEGVPSYVAESMKEGDIMKDSLGRPAIKIVKKIVEDAKLTVITANGDVTLQKHPMRKDVYLYLEIWAEKIGDRNYLFGDTNFPILIGSKIDNKINNNIIDNRLPFYTNNSLVWLNITKINGIK
mgnify:CR=1 FL=1